MTEEDIIRVTLGCKLLTELCDVLHDKMFQSNPQNFRVAYGPHLYKANCSLLCSVTDSGLPAQPSGGGKCWFPPERQVKDAQSDQDVAEFLESPRTQTGTGTGGPSSISLDDLVQEKSIEQLQEMCRGRGIAEKNGNRMAMAKSILLHDAQAGHPQARKDVGKVLCVVDCCAGMVLTLPCL